MAVRDIKSANVETNGWIVPLTFDTMGTGGTYAPGYGTNNDPADAKISLSFTSQGYSNSGVLGTKAQTVQTLEAETTIWQMRIAPQQVLYISNSYLTILKEMSDTTLAL